MEDILGCYSQLTTNFGISESKFRSIDTRAVIYWMWASWLALSLNADWLSIWPNFLFVFGEMSFKMLYFRGENIIFTIRIASVFNVFFLSDLFKCFESTLNLAALMVCIDFFVLIRHIDGVRHTVLENFFRRKCEKLNLTNIL